MKKGEHRSGFHGTVRVASLLVMALAVLPSAFGQMIDFERMPDGSLPVAKTGISNQFQAAFGVSFQLADTNGVATAKFPKLATVDDASFAAFVGSNGTNHPPANQNAGKFFLTGVQGLSAPPHTLLITYTVPTAAASGAILDIDVKEFWEIRFVLTNGTVITNHLYSTNFPSPSPNSGDGLATWWSVSHSNADISAIVLAGNNLNGATMGWGLDNFSPRSATPQPILSISNAGPNVVIGLAGDFGSTNQIQYSPSLSPTNWQVWTNAVLTNAPLQYYTNQIAPGSRFYRAIRLP